MGDDVRRTIESDLFTLRSLKASKTPRRRSDASTLATSQKTIKDARIVADCFTLGGQSIENQTVARTALKTIASGSKPSQITAKIGWLYSEYLNGKC